MKKIHNEKKRKKNFLFFCDVIILFATFCSFALPAFLKYFPNTLESPRMINHTWKVHEKYFTEMYTDRGSIPIQINKNDIPKSQLKLIDNAKSSTIVIPKNKRITDFLIVLFFPLIAFIFSAIKLVITTDE